MDDLKTSGVRSACRYVQNNKLTSLAGLAQVSNLTTLNAAGNSLISLDGVRHCAGLNTLQAGGNSFSGVDAIAAVRGCPALLTLDLQDNQITDAAGLLQLLEVPAMRMCSARARPLPPEQSPHVPSCAQHREYLPALVRTAHAHLSRAEVTCAPVAGCRARC